METGMHQQATLTEWMGFYSGLRGWLWSAPEIPDPAAVADWIESRAWQPADAADLCLRLRAWPEGAPYPVLPDDLELGWLHARGPTATKHRAAWWTPGAMAGGAGLGEPRLLSRMPPARFFPPSQAPSLSPSQTGACIESVLGSGLPPAHLSGHSVSLEARLSSDKLADFQRATVAAEDPPPPPESP